MELKVRNKYNIVIGWVRTYGKIHQAISLKKGYVGQYNEVTDITLDKDGKIFAYGNATDTLVRMYE